VFLGHPTSKGHKGLHITPGAPRHHEHVVVVPLRLFTHKVEPLSRQSAFNKRQMNFARLVGLLCVAHAIVFCIPQKKRRFGVPHKI